jgi:hypothetical protein
MKMKQRILTNWTFTRALYLVVGITVIVQSVLSQQWFGAIFGGYFAAMGLFAFGCASGNCFGGNCAAETLQKSNATIEDVDFEEVKTK